MVLSLSVVLWLLRLEPMSSLFVKSILQPEEPGFLDGTGAQVVLDHHRVLLTNAVVAVHALQPGLQGSAV